MKQNQSESVFIVKRMLFFGKAWQRFSKYQR